MVRKMKDPLFHLFKITYKHADEMKLGLELEIGNKNKGKKDRANSGPDL